MAAKRKPGSRPGLIHCDNCGEDYSASYRRCPFCDEYDDYENAYDEYENEPSKRPAPRGGGKRLAPSNRRGGGYKKTSPGKIISIIISLIVILAAIWIIATKIWPLIHRGNVGTVDPNASTSQSADPDHSASPDVSPGVSDPGPAASDPAADPTDVSPSPGTSPASSDGGATGFSLNESEFAFSDRYPDPITLKVTFTPAGTTGSVTWSSSDPDIASVDENGKVSHGTKSGTATITATLSNGVTQTCKVYNQTSGSAAPSSSGNSGAASGSYSINKTDFTFYSVGEKCQLKVNGYTGTVSWSSSNSSIVSVSSDGTCTAVGTGTGRCTITGTLENGSTVTAIARINIS